MILFTPPDIIILAILIFFTAKGFKNGFIKEAARIIGMIGGFISAHNLNKHITPYLELYFLNPIIRDVVSYLSIFCITLIIIKILGIFVFSIDMSCRMFVYVWTVAMLQYTRIPVCSSVPAQGL